MKFDLLGLDDAVRLDVQAVAARRRFDCGVVLFHEGEAGGSRRTGRRERGSPSAPPWPRPPQPCCWTGRGPPTGPSPQPARDAGPETTPAAPRPGQGPGAVRAARAAWPPAAQPHFPGLVHRDLRAGVRCEQGPRPRPAHQRVSPGIPSSTATTADSGTAVGRLPDQLRILCNPNCDAITIAADQYYTGRSRGSGRERARHVLWLLAEPKNSTGAAIPVRLPPHHHRQRNHRCRYHNNDDRLGDFRRVLLLSGTRRAV